MTDGPSAKNSRSETLDEGWTDNMFQTIKASQRNRLTQSLFTSTFAICFMLVGASSIVPCPVDSVHSNDSVVDSRMRREEKEFTNKE